MSWKLVLVGGLVFYAASWVVGIATGPLVHGNLLEPLYEQHPSFWRPELSQEPPDMKALLPRWITVGLIGSFLLAAVYGWLRPAFRGPGWKKGLQFGLAVATLNLVAIGGWSGIFNLPDAIWGWWALEGFVYHAVGGIALGWVAEWVAPA